MCQPAETVSVATTTILHANPFPATTVSDVTALAAMEARLWAKMENRISSEVEARMAAGVRAELNAIERRLEAKIEAMCQQSHSQLCHKVCVPAQTKPLESRKQCFVCGGGTSIHKHRELGVLLDDRCRKQVETYKQGSTVVERRDQWVQSLERMPGNELACRMLTCLRQTLPPSKKRKVCDSTHVRPAAITDGTSHCTVCQSSIDFDKTPATTLPCNHTFHEGCITAWLKRSSTCPVCRATVPGCESHVHNTGLCLDLTPASPTLACSTIKVELQSEVENSCLSLPFGTTIQATPVPGHTHTADNDIEMTSALTQLVETKDNSFLDLTLTKSDSLLDLDLDSLNPDGDWTNFGDL